MTTLPASDAVAERSRAILEAHWRPLGYTVPNDAVYPHQWLWDSCFHAVVWTVLGAPDRAVSELERALAHQADDGFVPHMTYWEAPDQHAAFWGRRTTSAITQPPMYGHALAELVRHGHTPPADLVARAVAGLEHLAERRSIGGGGMVPILHPWESGCDDSPRWDSWCPGGWTATGWKQTKGDLVGALRFDPRTGSPCGSDAFIVGSVGWNALVAFNCAELATVVTDAGVVASLRAIAAEVRAATSARWDDELGCEHDWSEPYRSSSGIRTLDAMLGVLAAESPPARVIAGQLRVVCWDGAFGGDCGPAAVHRDEPTYDPTTYWRGSAWPQLTYLCWVAARRAGMDDEARRLGDALVRGAWSSGFAEFWHPDTGAPLGAVPQSWAALAAVVSATSAWSGPPAGR